MFFTLSKLFWMVFTPLTFTGICFGCGTALRRYRFGIWLLRLGVVLFFGIGCLPIGHNILVRLENTYSAPELPVNIDGIIVLGGAIELSQSIDRQQPQLNIHANRLTSFIALSHRYPQAKLVFTGGNGGLNQSSSNESEQFRILLKEMNFNDARLVYEGQSRNTYENMTFSYDLVHPQAGENWVLITSAYHLPRAVGVFHSADWRVIPYPAGFLTGGHYIWWPTLDVLGGFYKFQVALREMVGIIAYTFTERITREYFAEDNTCLHSGSCAVFGSDTVIAGQRPNI